jgi:catechol 2,3-dioxygenase
MFYVKDLLGSFDFYQDLLGFKEVGRIFNGAAAAVVSPIKSLSLYPKEGDS